MNDSPSDFQTRLLTAQDGSESAKHKLVTSFKPVLLSIATSCLGSKPRVDRFANELVQQAIANATQNLGQCRVRTVDEFKAWLGHIMISQIRIQKDETGQATPDGATRHNSVSIGDEDDLNRTVNQDSLAVDKQRLLRALSKIPLNERRVIEMRQRDNQSFDQIADQLKMSVDAVNVTWNRAIEQLAQVLAEDSH
ncbi:RNA polymerase sigma factor RpoE [Planctomycetes bacterium K23_9]|uniref:RNA polymerase sigma factor RpoE n=1 Tax=Stieleria marina TaxID=1930275 RepID=A0A517NP40_9BACT|nr:RNA polymerase sigma factor RpoE [Planctomycetes bacterium K23_9]